MVVVDIESDFVNPEVHKPRGVTELIVLEEFKPTETDYGVKWAGKVQTNGTKPEVKVYQMNNTSAKTAKKCLGEDSLSWVNKRLAIKYVEGNTPNGIKDIIYVDELRTIQLNASPTPPPTTAGTETPQPTEASRTAGTVPPTEPPKA